MTSPRPSQITMTPLRAKMMQQMQLHRLAPGTQQLYAKAITDLACYFWRSPDQLKPDDIRAYLHHLLEERQLAWSTCNVTAAAIRFLYVETLDWTPFKLNLPPRPNHQRLPQVLKTHLEGFRARLLDGRNRKMREAFEKRFDQDTGE